MALNTAEILEFETEAPARPEPFWAASDAFDGPIDLLVELARAQKIDLAAVPVARLVDDFVTWLGQALRHKTARLEAMGDHLVAMAWLLALRTRLLLPRPTDPNALSADAEADLLRRRLTYLVMLRDRMDQLLTGERQGVDWHFRGHHDEADIRNGPPDRRRHYYLLPLKDERGRITYPSKRARPVLPSAEDERAALYALARDCIAPRLAPAALLEPLVIRPRAVVPFELAMAQLRARLALDPLGFDLVATVEIPSPALARSAIAASFSAALELAREGALQIAQSEAFGPLRIVPAGLS